MEFNEILKQLMTEKGVSAYKMSKETGIPQPVIGRWKNAEQMPSSESLTKIANYFCVSTDYLLSRTTSSLRENEEFFENKRIVLIGKNGKTVKKILNENEWKKYNELLKAAMPELYID